jgi:hypothetical protein
MIKLLTLFLLLNVANAQTLPYLLPDEKSSFDHTLIAYLKKAQTHIVILTPSLNHPALRRQLVQSLSKGIKLTLIIQTPAHDPLQLVAYNGVDFNLYDARPLDDTLILVDDTALCHLSGGLNEEELAQKTQNAICSDENELIKMMQKNAHRILTRSHPYLK